MVFIDLQILKIGCVNYAPFPKSGHILAKSHIGATLIGEEDSSLADVEKIKMIAFFYYMNQIFLLCHT